MRIGEIIAALERAAPPQSALEWDNVGLQVGARASEVSCLLVCLEITDAVVTEAERVGAGLIVAHHPLIFRPLAAVTAELPVGRLLQRLLCAGIAVYCAHTNLDAAPKIGTAAALAQVLGIRPDGPLLPGEPGLGAVGSCPQATTVGELAARVSEALRPPRLVVVGDPDRAVGRVALMPGAGGDAVLPAAQAGADALVCGELGHHAALEGLALGVAVIDAGHYATEHPVVRSVACYLRRQLGEAVRVIESEVVTDPFAAA